MESQLALQHVRRIRLTWHSKQQKKRQGKYSQVWSDRLPILMGSTQQSMKLSFLMKVIPQDLALAFPVAFLPFWSAFLSSARSVLPASLWKLFFSWLKRSAGSSQTIKKGQCESVSPSRRRRRRTSFLKKKKRLMLFVNTWNVYFLKHRGIMDVVCTPLFVRGHSRTRKMSMYSNHQR